ncbi:MAG: nucleotidyltransferase domain-containing protein [Proteobacteria bacterium]|nr:nucleotidyltransferase domain-containing protein [Pseudomonadota bacterium]
MVDTTIPGIARRYLQRLVSLGVVVERGIIFGSHARGEASKWSDIDLIVVSPRFDTPRTRDDINLLWRVAVREDSRIEPIPCGSKEWLEGNTSAIVEMARREGKELAP